MKKMWMKSHVVVYFHHPSFSEDSSTCTLRDGGRISGVHLPMPPKISCLANISRGDAMCDGYWGDSTLATSNHVTASASAASRAGLALSSYDNVNLGPQMVAFSYQVA